MVKVGDIWYRYEDVTTAPPIDEYDNICGESRLYVNLREFKVEKITLKGVWLRSFFGTFSGSDTRFVLNDSRKRFACATVEEAKVSFIARKTRQAGIYESRAKQARQAIVILEHGKYSLQAYMVQ